MRGWAGLLALLLAAGCARSAPGSPPVPEGVGDILGTITHRAAVPGGWSVRIQQDSTRSAGYPAAQLRVEGGTRVLRRDGGRATAADLRVGMRVQAWFTGPVAQSFPVQAVARRVVIEP